MSILAPGSIGKVTTIFGQLHSTLKLTSLLRSWYDALREWESVRWSLHLA